MGDGDEGSSPYRFTFVIFILSIICLAANLPSLMQPQASPEGESIPLPAQLQPLTDHVLLLVLDGVPNVAFNDEEMMPFMATNFQENGIKAEVLTSPLTLTGACVKEMSTGRHAAPIDALRNWEVQNEIKDDPFNYALDAGLSVAFTGFYVWESLYTDPGFNHVKVEDYGFSDISEGDNDTLEVVEDWYAFGDHNLMVAHLGGTDHAGHIHGIESEVYAERMLLLDNQLQFLVDNLPQGWTIMITADHGMSSTGGHALGTGPEAEEVYFYAQGEGVADAGLLPEIIDQRDISSLFSSLLGLPLPVAADSKIPLGMLDVTDQKRDLYEEWNWEAIVALHDWRVEQGMSGNGGLSEEIAWEELTELTPKIPLFGIISGIVCSIIVVVWLFRQVDRLGLFRQSNKIELGLAAFLAITVFYSYGPGYDVEIMDVSMRWVRKLMGIFPLLGIMLLIFRHMHVTRQDYSISYALFFILVGLFFLPDTRMTIIMLGISLLLFYSAWGNSNLDLNIRQKVFLLTLFFILNFQLFNYLPRFIGVSSLTAWFGIDFLYKMVQRIVLGAMVNNLLASSFIMASTIAVLWGRKTGRDHEFRLLGAVCLVVIYMLAVFQLMSTDWILIISIIGLILFKLTSEKGNQIEAKTGLTISELILAAWVIPTWGVWPFATTILLLDLLKPLNSVIWSKFDSDPEEQVYYSKYLLPTLFAFSFLSIIWFNFAQLTTMGLLEFNPSKLIVTGGFFGARTAPPVLWMALMIAGPPMYCFALGLNRLRKLGIDLDGITNLLCLILFSSWAILWLGVLRVEVFLMLGVSSGIYLIWFGLTLLVNSTMSAEEAAQFNERPDDVPLSLGYVN